MRHILEIIKMRHILVTLSISLTLAVQADDATNEDLILAPPSSKGEELEEKLMVMIPGAKVATSYYTDPMTAVQEMTNLRLWVVVPSFDFKLCILACTSTYTCEPMNWRVNSAISKAVQAGYDGPTDTFFMAGHSLGGVCAATYTQAYNNTGTENVLANIIYGSYVTDQDVETWSVPVMTVGAELDGGLSRPGNLLHSIQSSDKAAAANDKIYSDWQMINKPALILKGMDHSDFCPGFQVPGDVYPSAIVDKAVSNQLIANVTSNFLHLHTEQSDDIQENALSTLREKSKWTRENLLKPMTDAITQLEGSVDDGQAPWCEKVQPELVGFLNDADRDRLSINSIYKDESHAFEHTRVHYKSLQTESGFESVFNISGHNQYYGGSVFDVSESCLTPAKELGCKMASSDRVAEQLHLGTGTYNNTLTCMDMNKIAYETAIQYLNRTSAGQEALERFGERGRPVCFTPDFDAPGNIGPLWVMNSMTIKDDVKNQCLQVASLKLGPQSLDSWIFPGVHYCKLLSPARVIDYIMIDSLKDKSGCLNTKSDEEDFVAFN